MTIRQQMMDDPQKLVDEATEFEFNEVEGRVKLIDGWAAGGSWQEFEFVSGPHAGRKIWCNENYPGESFTYYTEQNDDGFIFNPSNPGGDDDVPGGGFYPDWDEKVFTIKEKV